MTPLDVDIIARTAVSLWGSFARVVTATPDLAAPDLKIGPTFEASKDTHAQQIVLEPPDVMAPSFGPGSFARHAALGRAAGAAVRVRHVPSLAFDVDTPADVAALAAA